MSRNELIEQHYRENYDALVRRIQFRVGGNIDVAEEVVQEAYTRALKYFKKFNPKKGLFDQWFALILNNALNALKNEEKHRGVKFEIDDDEEWDVPEELVVYPQEKEIRFRKGIAAAIWEENERDRNILTMFFFDGFKTTDISEFIGVNHSNVRSIIKRFRDKLIAAPEGII